MKIDDAVCVSGVALMLGPIGYIVTIRVLIADDHRLLRDGIRRTLTAQGMSVIGEASDGDEAVELALKLLPDVVLMDVSMPYCDGIEAARLIKEVHPGLPIVILTMHEDDEVRQDSIDVGVDKYLVKDCSATDIVNTILHVARKNEARKEEGEATQTHQGGEDEKHAGEKTANKENMKDEDSIFAGYKKPKERSLSPREVEVLQLLVDGLSVPEVAERLSISERTCRNHLSSTYEKLGVTEKSQALLRSIQLGYVVLPPAR